jgi:uncharacterized LabA/DUF88 family protein
MSTYAYIDASNLFYGGKKSLGWSIDYKKLQSYLKEKYEMKRFAGDKFLDFEYLRERLKRTDIGDEI